MKRVDYEFLLTRDLWRAYKNTPLLDSGLIDPLGIRALRNNKDFLNVWETTDKGVIQSRESGGSKWIDEIDNEPGSEFAIILSAKKIYRLIEVLG